MSTSIEPALQAIILEYDRNKGFAQIEMLDKLAAEHTVEFIQNYISKIEKDVRVRELTNKSIIRVLLVISLLILILLFSLANFISAIICFLTILTFAYFIGFLQAKKLKAVIEDYNLKIAGSDWDFFGCFIENKFGKKPWTYYAYFPWIQPTIQLFLKVKPRQQMRAGPLALPNRPPQVTDNHLILKRIKDLQSEGIAVPIQEKDIKQMVLKRYQEQDEIELGNHDQNSADLKAKESEKLFS
jgi:hypothetical protein